MLNTVMQQGWLHGGQVMKISYKFVHLTSTAIIPNFYSLGGLWSITKYKKIFRDSVSGSVSLKAHSDLAVLCPCTAESGCGLY